MRRVALLRAVNVAGHGAVPMADLREVFADLGCGDVQTVLASGNVLFHPPPRSGPAFESTLEAELARRLGLRTAVFVRDAAAWDAVVAGNPFRAEAERDPGRLHVAFFKSAPSATAVKALQAAIVGREVVRAGGRHAYIVYPDGAGRSRLTTALIEKTLGTRTTARNWNTVRRLGALLGVE